MRSTRLLVALTAVLLCAGCSDQSVPLAPSPHGAPTTTATPTPESTGPPLAVATVGDSLSVGFDACDQYGPCNPVSWATGADPRVDSVASRLREATGRPVAVRAVARAGATSADLAAQVSAAVAGHADLITLQIGANDVCAAPSVQGMRSTTEYASAIGDALRRITAAAPDAVVLVASVPDVTALLAVGAWNPTSRFLWSRGGTCPAALADPQATSAAAVARRAAVRAQITAYDAVLAARCAAAPGCVYDGGALHDRRPTPADLSALDAFHPSVRGLHELAALEWRALSTSPRAAGLLR